MYPSSEYARVTQGSGYVWVILEYPRMWLIMSEYDRIWVNMPQSAWMAFVLHFPISPFFLQSLSTQTHDYLFECL